MHAPRVTTLSTPDARSSPKPSRRFCIPILLLMIAIAIVFWRVSLRSHAGPAGGQSLTGTLSNQVPRQTLRVGTFNIHSGIGVHDGKLDLDRTARVLEGLDLVGLNEVRGPGFWQQADQAKLLGRKLEMPFLFAPSERRWGSEHFGNGMLCSLPVKNWLRIPLPSLEKKGLRNMLLATVDLGGRDVHVLITHVDKFTDRKNQLRIIIALFLTLDEPAILMGDLNSSADDEQLQALLATEGVHDVIADVGRTNGRGYDWIITRGLKTIRATGRENDASDHPLVSAELRLAD